MKHLRTYIVNAFVNPSKESALGSGNPAAVTLLSNEEEITDEERQCLATEINLAETAYITASDEDGENHFNIRWFTPKTEVALCGHATLASAAAVVEEGWAKLTSEIVFNTRKHGKLYVNGSIIKDKGMMFSMRLPALLDKKVVNEKEQDLLIKGLCIKEQDVKDIYLSNYDHVVCLNKWEDVKRIRPNLEILKELKTRCILVTAKYNEDEEIRFCCRAFAPRMGIDEDPVTGSAYCVLARLYLKIGEQDVKAIQLSKRGGDVIVGRNTEKEVIVSGHTKVFSLGHVRI